MANSYFQRIYTAEQSIEEVTKRIPHVVVAALSKEHIAVDVAFVVSWFCSRMFFGIHG